MEHFVRNPYNYDRKEAGAKSAIDASHDGRTQQEFKDECDINVLVERFGIGVIEQQTSLPMYGDFTNVTDFHTSLTAVREAAEQFMLLPADVRRNFDNDPQKLMDFVEDSNNDREAWESRGLVPEVVNEAKTPIPAPSVPEEPPGGAVTPAGGEQPPGA